MYASQTKRLCVREASSDETRVQHRSTSEANNSGINIQPNSPSTSSSSLASTLSAPLTTTTPPTTTTTTTTTASTSSQNLPAGIMTANTTASQESNSSIYHDNHHHQQQNSQQSASSMMSSQNFSSEHELIDRLAQETMEATRLELLLSLRNLITACNKKRDSIVSNPNFIKLIELIENDKLNSSVKAQIALLLCSIAKSGEHNIRLLNQLSVDERIFHIILSFQDEALTEACFRCLRSIMSWPGVSRATILYDSHIDSINSARDNDTHSPRANLFQIIQYALNSDSLIVQECVADIFSATCTRSKDQTILYTASAVPCIAKLLESPSDRVVVAALNWMTQMCLKNRLVASQIESAKCPSGMLASDRLIEMMSKDKCDEIQFLSARAFTHIYKALVSDNPTINYPLLEKCVLPTLVRMIHINKPSQLRVKSAECLAYLIEGDKELQGVASNCDHLINSLANMLVHDQEVHLSDSKRISTSKCRRLHDGDAVLTWFNGGHKITARDHHELQARCDLYREYDLENISEHTLELRRAAFVALAALGSEEETIRKKILDTCSIMKYLVKSLSTNDTKTLKAALTCLLSLSRSVQQLRTSFAESNVYSALRGLLDATSNDVLILVLAILCNVSLEFSAGKQHYLDETTIETLCNFTKRPDATFRLHGLWTLMNMVYQLGDLNLKLQILRSLGINHVMNLVRDDEDEEIVLKTLGFLRNLLSQEEHIDAIMGQYGEQIMSSIVYVLGKPCSPRIKEQTLCVLANIASENGSKSMIMNDKFILSYLAKVICDEQAGNLRLAAVCCISNLAYKDFDKSRERCHEMNKFGIEEKLKSMLSTSDPALSDKVRTAYNQFG